MHSLSRRDRSTPTKTRHARLDRDAPGIDLRGGIVKHKAGSLDERDFPECTSSAPGCPAVRERPIAVADTALASRNRTIRGRSLGFVFLGHHFVYSRSSSCDVAALASGPWILLVHCSHRTEYPVYTLHAGETERTPLKGVNENRSCLLRRGI